MLYPFKHQHQHEAEAIVIFCMDFRFWQATLKFLEEELGLNSFDLCCLAGASKNFIEPKTKDAALFVENQIKLSLDLHKIKKIVIVDHADCGAYGGRRAFKDEEQERSAHLENLRKVKMMLAEKFPEQKIVLIYANLEGDQIKFECVK